MNGFSRRVAAGLVAAATLTGANTPAGSQVSVDLAGLRNAKGVVHFCLTSEASRFLQCKDDKGAVALTVAAGKAAHLMLGPVKPGTYALLVVHDENGNGKLDMMMGIPREGFGFSNNPKIHMRAPRFDEVRFAVQGGAQTQSIRLRYIL
jgi:uncharacterized protein (DUF2141 family)